MSLFTKPVQKMELLDTSSAAKSWDPDTEACPRCLYIDVAGDICVDMIDGVDDEKQVVPVDKGFWAGTIKKLHTTGDGTTATVRACW